jgi:hypothetical protein
VGVQVIHERKASVGICGWVRDKKTEKKLSKEECEKEKDTQDRGESQREC